MSDNTELECHIKVGPTVSKTFKILLKPLQLKKKGNKTPITYKKMNVIHKFGTESLICSATLHQLS
jgi:hypothetical protein